MPNLYKYPCFCGLFIPIETHQAGCRVNCSCGQQVQVPTLSEILKLEPVTEQETPKKEKTKQSTSPTTRSIHAKQVVLLIGTVAFLVAGSLFLYFALRYPKLHDVCLMQWRYIHDGKVIGRDTQPIAPRDFRLLVDDRITPPYYLIWTEETINRLPYIDYHPILLVEMHDNLKGGLALSYNFNEKYEKLVFYYWARFVVFGVITMISLIILMVGVFLPKHVEDIGERGGENWE